MLVLAGVVYFVLVGWGNGLKIFIAAKSSVCYASKAELRLDVPGEVSRKSLLHGKTFFFCLCFTRWMTGRPRGQEKLWQGLLLQGLTLGKCVILRVQTWRRLRVVWGSQSASSALLVCEAAMLFTFLLFMYLALFPPSSCFSKFSPCSGFKWALSHVSCRYGTLCGVFRYYECGNKSPVGFMENEKTGGVARGLQILVWCHLYLRLSTFRKQEVPCLATFKLTCWWSVF